MNRFSSRIHRRLIASAFVFAGAIAVTVTPISSIAAPTVRLAGNYTVVTLSHDFVSALSGLGVAANALGLSALNDGRAYFPIISGAVDAANARGEISHLGGLTLTAGAIRVELSDFSIDTTGTPRLTGLVVANGDVVGRIPLFALALPNLSLPLQPVGRLVRIPGVGVTLTNEAAQALNATFGVSAFMAGFNIGTADVRAIIRRNASIAHVHVPRGRDALE